MHGRPKTEAIFKYGFDDVASMIWGSNESYDFWMIRCC
jgi:hypothetical protein